MVRSGEKFVNELPSGIRAVFFSPHRFLISNCSVVPLYSAVFDKTCRSTRSIRQFRSIGVDTTSQAAFNDAGL
jgi:hypothetical protein